MITAGASIGAALVLTGLFVLLCRRLIASTEDKARASRLAKEEDERQARRLKRAIALYKKRRKLAESGALDDDDGGDDGDDYEDLQQLVKQRLEGDGDDDGEDAKADGPGDRGSRGGSDRQSASGKRSDDDRLSRHSKGGRGPRAADGSRLGDDRMTTALLIDAGAADIGTKDEGDADDDDDFGRRGVHSQRAALTAKPGVGGRNTQNGGPQASLSDDVVYDMDHMRWLPQESFLEYERHRDAMPLIPMGDADDAFSYGVKGAPYVPVPAIRVRSLPAGYQPPPIPAIVYDDVEDRFTFMSRYDYDAIKKEEAEAAGLLISSEAAGAASSRGTKTSQPGGTAKAAASPSRAPLAALPIAVTAAAEAAKPWERGLGMAHHIARNTESRPLRWQAVHPDDFMSL